jgi:membrane protease YdiL (CAAX protease family)
MSQAIEARPQLRTARWVASGAAAGLLLARPALTTGPSRPVPWLVAIYVGILAFSVATPAIRDTATLPRAAVLALGLGAVWIAGTASGTAIPAPVGALAGAVALNSLAAVSEEAFFRRFLYGRLASFGAPLAIAGSAILFALVHLPTYGLAALPVDLGAGMLLGWQRWASGSWLVPAATHVWANLLAVLR